MKKHDDDQGAGLAAVGNDTSSAAFGRQADVRCGDCVHFVRAGRCNYLNTPQGRDLKRPFEHAPFWVWSDCYSDKEQVRADVTSACPTFSAKVGSHGKSLLSEASGSAQSAAPEKK